MKTNIHYANIPGAYPVRRSALEFDEGPEPTPEEKKAELKALADKLTAVLEEKPRRRKP